MPKAICQFLTATEGSAMLEYSLVMAAVALGVISAVTSLGEILGGIFQTIIAAIASMSGTAAG